MQETGKDSAVHQRPHIRVLRDADGKWRKASDDQCCHVWVSSRVFGDEIPLSKDIADELCEWLDSRRGSATRRWLPECGLIEIPVVRDHDGKFREAVDEPSHGTLSIMIRTNLDNCNPDEWQQLTEEVFARKSDLPFPCEKMPFVTLRAHEWADDHGKPLIPDSLRRDSGKPASAEARPTISRNEYQGDGTPDAILAWLRSCGSALSTDAANEIESLRAALLKIYEQAARNRWHIFSVIASDALNGKRQ